MGIWKLPEGVRFSNRQLIAFLLPILFEQLIVAGLNMADTFMVSFLGETALAGVSLVKRIDNFVKAFFLALAQGGSVVLSQYIGANDEKFAKLSLKNNIRIVVGIGMVVTLGIFMFKKQILQLLFSGAEPEVLAISSRYLTVEAISYPFIAMYYAGTSSFRAMGESKVPFVASVSMMSINVLLKYLFIFPLQVGVTGAAISTTVAMGTVGFALMIRLRRPRNKVVLSGMLKRDFDLKNAGKILKVSVPNGIEQGMFQLGALAIAGLVSGLGTAAIAADSIARTISPLLSGIGAAFNALMMMVIGQCMGAGKPEEAQMYAKHILKMDYAATLVESVVFLLILRPVVSIFNVSPEAQNLAFWIMVTYCIGSVFLYPTSFAMAAGLRGSGDTRFVMLVAVSSMFLFRIGAAYIFVHVFDFGVLGTWFAMVSDWAIRSCIFVGRYKRGKWKENHVI